MPNIPPTSKIKKISLSLFLIITILPFLILSFFANPMADDLAYTNVVHKFGFLKAQAHWYNGWNGRFFSDGLLSVNPLVFDWMFGYKIIPAMLILLLFFSIFLLTNEFCDNSLPRVDRLMMTVVIIFLYFYKMPSIPEGLYWMAASITYLLPSILTIFLLVVIIKLNKENRYINKLFFLIISACLCVAIVGSNEASMLILLILLLSILFINFLIHTQIKKDILLLLLITIIASFVVIFAPGNARRAAYFSAHDMGYSILSSFTATIIHLRNWLSLPILLLTIMYIPVGYTLTNYFNTKNTKNIFSVNPFISIFLSLILVYSGFFLGFWSLGDLLPTRTIDVLYLIFLLSYFFNLQVLIYYLCIKFKLVFEKLPTYVVLMLFLLLVGWSLKGHNNIRIAYADLLKGRAYRYNEEIKKRLIAIEACESEICEVEGLKNKPASLFVVDITADEKDWLNQTFSTFYKKTVRIKTNVN